VHDRESLYQRPRNASPSPGASDFEAVGAVVEDALDDEFTLVCHVVEACDDRVVDALIDSEDRLDPLAHVERAKLGAIRSHKGMRGDRLGVDEQTVRDEGGVDVAQGVHDALDRDASQRPAA
jgi:hypothetical protein